MISALASCISWTPTFYDHTIDCMYIGEGLEVEWFMRSIDIIDNINLPFVSIGIHNAPNRGIDPPLSFFENGIMICMNYACGVYNSHAWNVNYGVRRNYVFDHVVYNGAYYKTSSARLLFEGQNVSPSCCGCSCA